MARMAHIYKRDGSPFWWMWFPKDEKGTSYKPESTRIPHNAPTRQQRARDRANALKMWSDRYDALKKGLHLILPKMERTFEEQAEWWIKYVVMVDHKSPETTISSVKILIAEFKDLPLATFQPSHAMEFMAKRMKGTLQLCPTCNRKHVLTYDHDGRYVDPVKARTANRDLDNLYLILKTAVRDGYIDRHPLRDGSGDKLVAKKKADEFEAKVFDKDEWVRFIATINEHPEIAGTPRSEGLALAYCALETLLRRGSLMKLTWNDYKDGSFRPMNAKVEIKWSPVTETASSYLAPLQDANNDGDGAFIFKSHHVSGDRKAAENHCQRWFERVCGLAGIKFGREVGGVTFHSFRHTGATWAIAAGVDAKTVMALGGWKNSKVFMDTYCHTDKTRVRAAAESILGNKVQQLKEAKKTRTPKVRQLKARKGKEGQKSA